MKTIDLIGQTVSRIGYGTMRLPGEHVWGPAKDHDAAIAVLKRSVELGITIIDTAWYYGPDVANKLVAEALYPYPSDLIIITKLGGARDDRANWIPAITPEELRAGMKRDLETLKLESVPIVHLRWMDQHSEEEFDAAVDTMIAMKNEGLFHHLGLSNVTETQLDKVLQKTPVVTVSNPYSIADRHDDAMVDRCAKEGIAYLPFFPLAVGKMDDNAVLQKWAAAFSATPSQVALAWLLKRSSVMLPIPGTSSLAHLEENFAANSIELSDEAFAEINAA